MDPLQQLQVKASLMEVEIEGQLALHQLLDWIGYAWAENHYAHFHRAMRAIDGLFMANLPIILE